MRPTFILHKAFTNLFYTGFIEGAKRIPLNQKGENNMIWHGFGYMGGWGFGGFGGWMMIFWLLLIVLLVIGVARMGRWRGGGCCGVARDGHDSHDAVDIARERYARGEISEDEFKKIKKDLS
jgi:putative membrane protein